MNPTSTTSVIRVQVGDIRQANGSVAPLAGVVLALYATSDATTPVPGLPTCTSDATGLCEFVVPNTELGRREPQQAVLGQAGQRARRLGR